jgi:type I restriction enzyme M protein
MILHDNDTADIQQGNTFTEPQFKNKDGTLKTFDFAVANPPFSSKNWTNGLDPDNDEFRRFEGLGIPPEKNGDYAFLLHMLKSLKSTGKGAIILPHGVLFRGNAEAEIRKNIIERGYIKGIIGLPANLFYGTGIPACIVVIDKETATTRKGIFMINASKGFIKDGNKNRLREQDIHKIVTVFNNQMSIDKYSRFVPIEEIKVKNEYNLNIPRYIDSSEPEDLQDINAHLNGGIPVSDIDSMTEYWQVYPSIKNLLFTPLRESYLKATVPKDEIVNTITQHQEFINHAKTITAVYNAWKEQVKPTLMNLQQKDNPKTIIHDLSESLLSAFSNIALIDKYDVYQKLMEHWEETMQDDLYVICLEGYDIGRKITYEYATKKTSKDAAENEQTGKEKSYDGVVIPKSLLIRLFYPDKLAELQKHQSELDSLAAELEIIVEENIDEDCRFLGLEDLKDTTIKARLKEIKNNLDDTTEYEVLMKYLQLRERIRQEKSHQRNKHSIGRKDKEKIRTTN